MYIGLKASKADIPSTCELPGEYRRPFLWVQTPALVRCGEDRAPSAQEFCIFVAAARNLRTFKVCPCVREQAAISVVPKNLLCSAQHSSKRTWNPGPLQQLIPLGRWPFLKNKLGHHALEHVCGDPVEQAHLYRQTVRGASAAADGCTRQRAHARAAGASGAPLAQQGSAPRFSGLVRAAWSPDPRRCGGSVRGQG